MNVFIADGLVSQLGERSSLNALREHIVDRLRRYPLPVMCARSVMSLFCNCADWPEMEQHLVYSEVDAIIRRFLSPQAPGSVQASQRQLDGNRVADQMALPGLVTESFAANLRKLTAAQLKFKCHVHGLLTSGTRDALVERLLLAEQRGLVVTDTPQQTDIVNPFPAVESVPSVVHATVVSQRRTRLLDFMSAAPTARHVTSDAHRATIYIAVDKRERLRGVGGETAARSAFAALVQSAADRVAVSVPGVCVKVLPHTLPCGDFAFLSHTEACAFDSVPQISRALSDKEVLETFSYAPLIIERKTFSDLLTSVITSHLAEQKELMQKAAPFRGAAVLIVEGSATEWGRLRQDERQRILSSSITASLVNRYRVLWTRSTDETAALVAHIALVTCYPSSAPQAVLGERPTVGGVLRCHRRASVTSDDVLMQRLRNSLQLNSMAIRMVSCVAGVSSVFARELLAAFVNQGAHRTVAALQTSSSVEGTMQNLWRLAVRMNSQERSSALPEHEPAVGHHALDDISDYIQRNLLDSNAKRRAFALLTHFIACDVY